MMRGLTQRGVSLVAMMIGLLIGMIAVLGSLSTYQTLTQVSTDTQLDTDYNAQLSKLITQVQWELQNAGFGLEPPPSGADISQWHMRPKPLPDFGAVWRHRDGLGAADPIVCSRIERIDDPLIGPTKVTYRLSTVKSTQVNACKASGDLLEFNDTAWGGPHAEKMVLMELKLRRLDNLSREGKGAGDPLRILLSRQTDSAPCSPYSYLPAQKRDTLTFTFETMADRNEHILEANPSPLPNTTGRQVFCLGNAVTPVS